MTTATDTLNPPAAEPPWYRQPWPLFIFALPLAAVIASFVSLYYAVAYGDSVVDDNAYKAGLAINSQIERGEQAAMGELTATLRVAGAGRIEVLMTGKPAVLDVRQPIILSLRHPTLSGHDRQVTLQPVGAGLWQGRIDTPLEAVAWDIALDSTSWRLAGVGHLTADGMKLVPMAPAE